MTAEITCSSRPFLSEKAAIPGPVSCLSRTNHWQPMPCTEDPPDRLFWSSWAYRYETMDQQTRSVSCRIPETPGLPFRWHRTGSRLHHVHIGDWLTPNHRWPGGLRQAADTIRENGFLPGIWIAPFIIGDHSEVYRNHPDWILRDRNGDPVIMLRSYTEPKQWGNSDCNYFVLDASHPDAFAWLTEVFTTLYAWGFRFFKTDFMLWNRCTTAQM